MNISRRCAVQSLSAVALGVAGLAFSTMASAADTIKVGVPTASGELYQPITQDIVVEDVAPPPSPSFSANPNPATVNEAIAFSNSSTDADSYAWDFGDGTAPQSGVDLTSVAHTYADSATPWSRER